MSAHNEDRPRDVVPLWRKYSITAAKGELASHGVLGIDRFNNEMVEELRLDWLAEKNIIVGIEFVSAALTLGLFDVAKDAAIYLRESDYINPAISDTVNLYLNKGIRPARVEQGSVCSPTDTKSHIYTEIAAIRKELLFYPRNPVSWCNLALNYTSLGLKSKAERAIRTALGLGPNNRFVLRSASRFYLHYNDAYHAQAILHKSGLAKHDPWIQASEIAIATSRNSTSSYIKIAKRFIETKRFSSFHLSELASAIGTIESKAGNIRKARPIIDFSLEQPTENSIAQAAWLHRNIGGVGAESGTTKSYEANAWFAFRNASWNLSFDQAILWHSQQPFSSRPLLLASYLSSVAIEDFHLSAEIAEYGLLGNPDDFGLINQLAYSLAKNNLAKQAYAILLRADPRSLNAHQLVVWYATCGLVHFRMGMIEPGRLLYKKSISLGEKIDSSISNIARLYYALEESRLGSELAENVLKDSIEKAKNFQEPFQLLMVEKARQALVSTANSKGSGVYIPGKPQLNW